VTREYRTYRAEGVVLRRRNIGEADSIFTVFTEQQGKFDAVARGIRKAKSRMRGHLEPLTISRFLLAQGRSLDVFTQAETVRALPRIREDFERWMLATYCAELVDRYTGDRAESRDLYWLFRTVLEGLEAGAPLAQTRCYFEFHLLRDAGFDPQVGQCAHCGEPLEPEPTLFSASVGGLVCRVCRPDAGSGRLCSVRAIKVLRHCGRTGFADFCGLAFDQELAEELESLLGDAVRYHMDREALTTRVAHEIARLNPPATPGTPAV
jgi:DNA repair protein RecO (recombination protein O)